MTNKRKNTKTGIGPTGFPIETDTTSSLTTGKPTTSSGLKNTLHGNIFQLKLLMLFLIRGITSDYQFHLGTEIPGLGGKFDDLIFKYSLVKDGEALGDKLSVKYRYLQAKHKQNEVSEKITAADLLNDNNGEFSLPKYFRSYCLDVIKLKEGILPESVRDCIICTNIGFDSEEKLKNSGIELISLDDEDKILTFDKVPNTKKTPTRYKLKKTEILRRKMSQWSDIHLLAKTLLEYVTDNKKLAISSPIFKSYHFALVEEEVIDRKEGKLCATFLDRDGRFRDILSEVTLVHYLEKLKLKNDDKKKIRVDSHKKLSCFDETSLREQLPKYSQSMELDFCVFKDFYDDLIAESIIHSEGQKANRFTNNFIQEINLSREAQEFRGKLRNIVFVHYWKDLNIQLSGSFGRKIISSTPEENKLLNESVDVEKEIGDFLDKLVFAVHTPNEVELDDILKREMSDRYNLNESDFQSDFILRNMLDWFKEKESNFMTSKEGIDILENGRKKMESLRATAVSIDYQRQLKELCEFNEESIREMAKKLKLLLESANQIECIATQLPKLTAGKVIAAVKELRRRLNQDCAIAKVNAPSTISYFQRKDSYLITSLTRLQKDRSKLEKTLKAEHCHHLLIVVCDSESLSENDQFFCNLFQEDQAIKKKQKVIIISQGGVGVTDDINFKNLSGKSKLALLSKEVLFQGEFQTVGALIKQNGQTLNDLIENGNPENVIDSKSMKELMEGDRVTIPSHSSNRFEKSLYIKRRLIFPFPFDIQFWSLVAEGLGNTSFSAELLQNECLKVNSRGEIQWLINEDTMKTEIWERINSLLEKRSVIAQSPSGAIPEEDFLIDHQDTLPRVVIVSGVAGTGKSSILSHYYETIKENRQDYWAIIINLTNHSKDFFKLKSQSIAEFSAIDFLVNLSIVDESPFARSLLKHRLETGDRIVIMLDGFDESYYHETVVHMIKTMKQTKINKLFVTTRSHMTSYLQFELSQLSYSLENFSEQGQVNYLTSLWKRNLNGFNETDLRLFTESLIERISKTLKDEKRNFLGIPLQCRILAECFQSEIEDSIQNGKTFDSLLESIGKLNLNLASLYRLLMDKKREIYRQEKLKAQSHNLLVESHIVEDMKNLEICLRNLAVRTMVSTTESVNILLGRKKQWPFQSDLDQNENKQRRTDHCVRFGLLHETMERKIRKIKFLHRTYAEYFMAEYLYKGFLLEENRHNKLLENESVRKLIVNKILAENHYDGVQIFIDCMLKGIVDGNDKRWHQIIIRRELPDRLHKFAEVLYTQLHRQKEKSPRKQSQNALHLSVKHKNETIFTFLCDCLDARFDRPEILEAMTVSFLTKGLESSPPLKIFCHLNSEAFGRFIRYYDFATQFNRDFAKHQYKAMKRLLGHLPPCDMEYSQWNGEEKKRIVNFLLEFMNNQRETLDKVFVSNTEWWIKSMFKMLLLNDNYAAQLQACVAILLQSKLHSNEFKFFNFIRDIFSSIEKLERQGQILKILNILRNLERNNLVIQMRGIVLTVEPEAFENIYETRQKFKNTEHVILPLEPYLLLNKDVYHMTRFHHVVFYGSMKEVEEMLNTVDGWLSGADLGNKNKAEQVLNNMTFDESGFTPLYVAAACHQHGIFRKLLAFLNKHLPVEKFQNGLVSTIGFLNNSLSDAIEFKDIDTFQLILSSVKWELGHKSLINVIKLIRTKESQISNILSQCNSSEFFNTLCSIVNVEEDGVADYTDLYDLVFQNHATVAMLELIDADHLQGLLKLNGTQKWTRHLLDSNLHKGFDMLSSHLLKHFNNDQLLELVATITTDVNSLVCNGGRTSSYWVEFTACFDQNDKNILTKFFKLIDYKLGENTVKELVIHNDSSNNIMVRSEDLTEFMSSHLSKENQIEVEHYWKLMAPPLIDETFFSSASPNFWLNKFSPIDWRHLLRFYLNYGSHGQLTKFASTITSVQRVKQHFIFGMYEGELHSIWNHVFQNSEESETNEILKQVTENMDTFGRDAAKTLLLHETDGVPLILKAISYGEDISDRLEILPKEIQTEIQQYIKVNAVPIFEKALFNPSSYMSLSYNYRVRLNTLIFYVKHCSENQLELFVSNITSLKFQKLGKMRSVWGGIFFTSFSCYDQDVKNVNEFMKCVSEKLGSSAVKELVLHEDGEGRTVLVCLTLLGEDKMLETMLSYLDMKDRKNIQRQTSEYYLEEHFKNSTAKK